MLRCGLLYCGAGKSEQGKEEIMQNRSLYFATETGSGYVAFKYLHQALKAAQQVNGVKKVHQVWLKQSEYQKICDC